jgi:protein SCO1/2
VKLIAPLTVAAALLAAPVAAQPRGPMSIPPGRAAAEQIPALREVGIDQKLDGAIPLDAPFTDDAGKDVTIGQYFGSRPVVLALVYYECPMLCIQTLTGLSGSLEALAFNPGKEFELVVVSIDPGETPALAANSKKTFLKRYGRQGVDGNVHFLTGREASIKPLADAVGFRYAYDRDIDQYAHPAAITVLTADGRVSKYLYGIEFAPRDLRLSLVEAAGGRIGTAIDQALLFCYHYDPETGKYGFVIMNVIRLGAALTVVALAGSIVFALRRERRQRRPAVAATGTR